MTLEVARGEAFGFLGPNGAGKTTAVKLMLGLVAPTTGSGTLLGAPLGDRATRRRIGYLPELFRYQEWLSGREVLALHCALAGLARATRDADIAEALAEVNLSERADDRVGTYSKGMQQRLGLAVALVGRPELVFLDEPTSALDPVGRHEVRAIIARLRARGTAVFLNSHMLGEVERVCDRVAIVDRGRVVASGTVEELLGAGRGVRLRLGNVGAEVEALLARAGTVVREGAWYLIRGPAEADVPALVAGLVTRQAEVYAVEQLRATLEDRFLEVLDDAHGAPDDRLANPA
ncbi:MAG: ABC transporter ATP-binding protein [Candidatus Baltobacteraceae bacterium]